MEAVVSQLDADAAASSGEVIWDSGFGICRDS